MNYPLTPEEREIEEHASEFVSITGQERMKVESIIERARKSRPVNLRMSEYDLGLVKRRYDILLQVPKMLHTKVLYKVMGALVAYFRLETPTA